MRRPAACLMVFLVLAVSKMPVARADISPDEVKKAIAGGVTYLKKEQRRDGSWPPYSTETVGTAALCTLALLNAGVEPDDEAIQRALKYLRKQEPKSTYARSLQTMVFAEADPKRDLAMIARNVKWLETTQIKNGDTLGSWSYPGRSGDNSNSQFALLALHEAERAGVEVSGRTWRLAKAYWEKAQNPDGSWGYRLVRSGTGSLPGSGSMTCAGIASLVITSNKVREHDAQVAGDQIYCCTRADSDDDRIERGMQWLGTNFTVTHNPHRAGAWLLYYLYGVERVGRLTARRFIGGHDWYREGTDHLIKLKGNLANEWTGVGIAETDRRVATSLALLFLSKGRRPVLLAKLKHGSDEEWNQHRSDVDNLTRYVESKWELDLTWQAVDLQAATVDDLLQSPVLYYCGRNSPWPGSAAARKNLAQKLRDYLDRGGFLFAEAYSSGSDFDRGFRQLISEVFPEPEYRLQLLPPEHSIWRAEERVNPKFVRPLWGIDFGCRTSVVYCPPDTSGDVRPSLSCLWELSRAGRQQKYRTSVQKRIDAGLSTGINVLAYATNRELKTKDEIPRHLGGQTAEEPFPRGYIYIANLRHPGGCNTAPRALGNLLEAAARELGIRTSTEQRQLNITDQTLFDYHLVFMHGRNRFHLTDAERKQLKTYVQRGGMLFANAICASDPFAESFRREMELVFPDRSLAPIAVGDPLFTPAYGGFDLSTVTRRDPQQRSGNEPLEDLLRSVPPDLEGIRFDDRWGVIFSRYDLSCALEKQNSLECQGYVREDAARIGLNVLLYSLQQ